MANTQTPKPSCSEPSCGNSYQILLCNVSKCQHLRWGGQRNCAYILLFDKHENMLHNFVHLHLKILMGLLFQQFRLKLPWWPWSQGGCSNFHLLKPQNFSLKKPWESRPYLFIFLTNLSTCQMWVTNMMDSQIKWYCATSGKSFNFPAIYKFCFWCQSYCIRF